MSAIAPRQRQIHRPGGTTPEVRCEPARAEPVDRSLRDASSIRPTQAEALARKVGDERLLVRLSWSAGYALMAQGLVAEAEQVARATLPRSEALGDEYYIALASTALGGIAFVKGDLDGALDLGLRGILSNHAMGDFASITLSLIAAAALLYVGGQPGDAVTIGAAYEAHRRRYGVQPPLAIEDWLGLGSVVAQVRALAAGGGYEENAQLGASMSTDAVMEFLVQEAIPRFKGRSAAEATAPAS